MGEGAKLIVVACNTASAAALVALREEYPGYPFVGIEPAVKPAARRSQTNIVGVLATPSTFKGEPYASLVERFAQDTQLLTDTCPGLVQEIEAGGAKGSEARRILRDALEPMLAQGIDSLVLGCTHYPFAIETIREIVGAEIEVLDPAPAIARHVQALLQEQGLLNPGPGTGWVRYSTTGDAARLREQIYELIGEDAETAALQWQGGSLGGLGT
jgi:glutamate racemase